MLKIRDHIASKVLVVLLTTVLIAPLFVKLNHLLENHKHEICETPYTNHFHELEVDCKFYAFKLNTQYNSPITSIEIPVLKKINISIDSNYFLVSDYQQLHFSLRGPPQFV